MKINNPAQMKKQISEEPLLAIILKGLAILTAVAAVYHFGHSFFQRTPLLPTDRSITQPEFEQFRDMSAGVFFDQIRAAVFFMVGILLWWMAEVISLLSKIVEKRPTNADVPHSKTKSELEAMIGSGKRPSRPTHDSVEDDVPRYSL